MILSRKMIQKLLEQKIITVTPQAEIKEASIKIHLSDKFSKDGNKFIAHENYILQPKEFVLQRIYSFA